MVFADRLIVFCGVEELSATSHVDSLPKSLFICISEC